MVKTRGNREKKKRQAQIKMLKITGLDDPTKQSNGNDVVRRYGS